MSLQFDELCRLCRSASKDLISMYEKCPQEVINVQFWSSENGISIIEMLIEIIATDIQLGKHSDKLPKCICSPCLGDLKQAYSFKKKCEASENFFKTYLEQNSLETETIEPVIVSKDQITNRLKDVETELQTKLQCASCEFFCYDENTLFYHLKTAHVETSIKTEEPDPIIEEPEKETSLVMACSKCGANFTIRKSLTRHEKSCRSTRNTFKCEICGWIYTRKGDLENHLKEKKYCRRPTEAENAIWIKEEPIQELEEEEPIPRAPKKETSKGKKKFTNGACRQCGATFALKKSLKIHEKGCKRKTAFKCEFCVWACTRRADLDKHKENKHPVEYQREPHKVEVKDKVIIDDFIFANPQTQEQLTIKEEVTEQHDPNVEPPEPKKKIVFACRKCGANFRHRQGLTRHENYRNCTKADFKCEICDWRFSRKCFLDKHRITHSRAYLEEQKRLKEEGAGNENVCKFCSTTFQLRSSLKEHLLTHSGEKPFLCFICGKKLCQRSSLTEHLMRHNNERPFKCPEPSCARGFVSKADMEKHFRIHSGELPFICFVCGVGRATSSALTKHHRIHTGERPYNCEFCSRKFRLRGSLKTHRRTHTGEKPFKCTYCEKTFKQKTELDTHTRTHTGEKPYKCVICEKTFGQAGNLKTHRLKIHIQQEVKTEPTLKDNSSSEQLDKDI